MKPDHAKALDILKSRDKEWTEVRLRGGWTCMVYDISWGYDLGEDVAHVTTNSSMELGEEHRSEFFLTNEILEIVDPDSGGVLFWCEDSETKG